MSSGWVPIYPLPVPYPCFEIGENSNSYPNPVKTGKTVKLGLVWAGNYGMGFVVMPNFIH